MVLCLFLSLCIPALKILLLPPGDRLSVMNELGSVYRGPSGIGKDFYFSRRLLFKLRQVVCDIVPWSLGLPGTGANEPNILLRTAI
jgi:hypothetical protein